MLRNYANIGSKAQPALMHYRQSGNGPVLLMLHASPMSSAALVPLINPLSSYATVIAPDTPGYGHSHPLSSDTYTIAEYAKALKSFCEVLGLSAFGLYGTATGAQIAIEFSKLYPELIDYLILDNAAHFTDEERDRITAGYFLDLTPDEQGSHIIKTWSMSRDQGVFFPWHEHDEETRLPVSGVNTDFVHMIAMEYLQSGENYDLAYRAAFANEKAERVLPITVPTTVVRWQSSILKPYTDRFDEHEWPANFVMGHCGPTREERSEFIVETVKNYIQGSAAAATPVSADYAGDIPLTRFIQLKEGQAHFMEAGARKQKTMLLLHNPGESAIALEDIARALGEHYHIIAPDLPGHGNTEISGENIDDILGFLQSLILSLDLSVFSLISDGLSAALALSLAQRMDKQIEQLVLLNPLDCSDLDAELYFPVHAADENGTHLINTWYMLRDRQLFWPWYERTPDKALAGQAELNGDYLTARLLDYSRAQGALQHIAAELFACPLKEKLPELDVSCRLAAIANDPLSRLSREQFNEWDFLQLPEEINKWNAVLN